MLVGPPIAGVAFMCLKGGAQGAFLALVYPVFLLLCYFGGWIPAFLAGMIYALLLRRGIVPLHSGWRRCIAGVVLGALFAPITAGIWTSMSQNAPTLSALSALVMVAASGAIAGGVCALLFPLKRWRSAF